MNIINGISGIVVSKRFTMPLVRSCEPHGKRDALSSLMRHTKGCDSFPMSDCSRWPPLAGTWGTPAEKLLKYYWNLNFCLDFQVSRKYSAHSASNPRSAASGSFSQDFDLLIQGKGAGYRVVYGQLCLAFGALLAGEKVLALRLTGAHHESERIAMWVCPKMVPQSHCFIMMI